MDMALTLYRTFQEAGLPPPHMRVEVPDDPDFAPWIYDLLCSVRPEMLPQGLFCDAVGDFETLLQRLQAEAAAAKTFGTCSYLVGAWSRKAGERDTGLTA